MSQSTHQISRNGAPVHPRIVRFVVAALLIVSLVRVCIGAATNGASVGGHFGHSNGDHSATNPTEH